MTSITKLFLTIILLLGTALSFQHSYIPKEGFVPDEKTAVRIAEAVLSPIYGEDKIKKERPFTAKLKDDVWTVEGSLPSQYHLGGVALVEIAKSDGRILRVSHGK